MWTAEGATSAAARFKPNLRLVLEWFHDAWMNIPRSTIQRCWWRTGCLPRAWAMELPHMEPGAGSGPTAGGDIGLDDDVNDVGSLIARLGLGPSAMPAGEFVGIDDNQPTCAEPGEDPLAIEPRSEPMAEMWEAPASMHVVYDDSNPATREARRTARAACEMLIDYARATCITPRDLCALFDIRNPIIVARMERASPALNLNASPPPAMLHEDNPPAETPRRRGRLLPAWTTVPTPDWVAQSARRQELIDAVAPAVMSVAEVLPSFRPSSFPPCLLPDPVLLSLPPCQSPCLSLIYLPSYLPTSLPPLPLFLAPSIPLSSLPPLHSLNPPIPQSLPQTLNSFLNPPSILESLPPSLNPSLPPSPSPPPPIHPCIPPSVYLLPSQSLQPFYLSVIKHTIAAYPALPRIPTRFASNSGSVMLPTNLCFFPPCPFHLCLNSLPFRLPPSLPLSSAPGHTTAYPAFPATASPSHLPAPAYYRCISSLPCYSHADLPPCPARKHIDFDAHQQFSSIAHSTKVTYEATHNHPPPAIHRRRRRVQLQGSLQETLQGSQQETKRETLQGTLQEALQETLHGSQQVSKQESQQEMLQETKQRAACARLQHGSCDGAQKGTLHGRQKGTEQQGEQQGTQQGAHQGACAAAYSQGALPVSRQASLSEPPQHKLLLHASCGGAAGTVRDAVQASRCGPAEVVRDAVQASRFGPAEIVRDEVQASDEAAAAAAVTLTSSGSENGAVPRLPRHGPVSAQDIKNLEKRSGLDGCVDAGAGVGKQTIGWKDVCVDLIRGTVQQRTDRRMGEAKKGVTSRRAAGSDSGAATPGVRTRGFIMGGEGRGGGDIGGVIGAGASSCLAGGGNYLAEKDGAVIHFTDGRRAAEAGAGASQWEEASQSTLGPVAALQEQGLTPLKPPIVTMQECRDAWIRKAEGAAEVLQQEPLGGEQAADVEGEALQRSSPFNGWHAFEAWRARYFRSQTMPSPLNPLAVQQPPSSLKSSRSLVNCAAALGPATPFLHPDAPLFLRVQSSPLVLPATPGEAPERVEELPNGAPCILGKHGDHVKAEDGLQKDWWLGEAGIKGEHLDPFHRAIKRQVSEGPVDATGMPSPKTPLGVLKDGRLESRKFDKADIEWISAQEDLAAPCPAEVATNLPPLSFNSFMPVHDAR
ncbi:unnamed protein product [Closterium sp. NIES-65]|nr:unnamed protein product [Closterium sp. NIES-65]